MKTVEVNFTDDEFAALLRYCSKKYFDPDTFRSICRMIVLSELIMNDFLLESEVIAGAIKMYNFEVPKLTAKEETTDDREELIVPYPPEEDDRPSFSVADIMLGEEELPEPPMEIPGVVVKPAAAKGKASSARVKQFSLPLKERSGKVTLTYRTFKWLVNNRMEADRFYTWLSSDVADALKITDHQSNSALTTLSAQRTPWVVRESEDPRGRIYWNFTEDARRWLSRNHKELTEAGMFEEEEEVANDL